MTEEKRFFEENVFSRRDYEFTFEVNEELIEEILKNKKSGKVLDLGCGEGGTSLFLAEKGFEVTCIDISKTAIKNIKIEAKKRNMKIIAIVADLEKFEFKEDYDILIGMGIFHFIPEKESLKLINNIMNHTKKDGLNIFEAFLQGDPSQEEDSEGYYFKQDELKELYSNWDILEYEEYEDYDKEEEQTNKIAFLIAKK